MKKLVFFLLIISNSLLLSMEPQRHISELAATEVMPLKYLAGKVVAKSMKDPYFRATVNRLDSARKALINRALIEENPVRLFEIFRP